MGKVWPSLGWRDEHPILHLIPLSDLQQVFCNTQKKLRAIRGRELSGCRVGAACGRDQNRWVWKKMLPQHPSSRHWCGLPLGSRLPALLLPLSCLLPSPAAFPPLPLRPQIVGRQPGMPAWRQSHPTFGRVPLPFPLPGSDTGEQLDPDRMP